MVECVHHYMIDSPNGAMYLTGQCKKCKHKRLFKAGFVHRAQSLLEKELRIAEEVKRGYR